MILSRSDIEGFLFKNDYIMSSESRNSGGIGVVGLLGVLFVALKLTDVIKWSWWLVLLPFWGWFALLLLLWVVVILLK